jgi:iron complex transport system ATP-binding protein
LESGTLLVLLGPNGAGKSTLLSILAGLQLPDSGKVLLEGRPLDDYSIKALARRRSVLEQRPILPMGFSVKTVLETCIYGHGQISAIEEAIALLGIEDLLKKDSQALSGGEAQRILLARSLIQLLNKSANSSYLLLDEPTASLDIGTSNLVMHKIQYLAHELSIGILVVLHDVNLALRYADQVGLMAEGKLLVLGKTAEVMHTQPLEALYQTALVELTDDSVPPQKAFVASGHLNKP